MYLDRPPPAATEWLGDSEDGEDGEEDEDAPGGGGSSASWNGRAAV